MTPALLLYTRKDCRLCDEMKEVIHDVAARIPLAIKEIDVDSSPEIQEKYGDEVPLLFIDDRKAFKYRVTARELEKKLRKGFVSGLAQRIFR
jgi:glutaredoxin